MTARHGGTTSDDRPSAARDVNELVERHVAFARHLARLFAHRGVPAEDLEQVAMLGLVLAAQRFDPERGVPFTAFASRTISGEIKRHFRDQTWIVRPTRRVQERYLAVQSEAASLSHTLGRSPTMTELADALGMTVEEVIEASDVAELRAARSLDAPAGTSDGEARPLSEAIGDADPSLAAFEDRRMVGSLIERLPHREQRVVEMIYFRDMSQREAAAILGVSQMQVSRIVHRALTRLRAEAMRSAV